MDVLGVNPTQPLAADTGVRRPTGPSPARLVLDAESAEQQPPATAGKAAGQASEAATADRAVISAAAQAPRRAESEAAGSPMDDEDAEALSAWLSQEIVSNAATAGSAQANSAAGSVLALLQ